MDELEFYMKTLLNGKPLCFWFLTITREEQCTLFLFCKLPKTLDDLYETGSTQAGLIGELRAPPRYKSVRGFISVPFTLKRLFFNELLSGIPKRETFNIRTKTVVQFSVGKDDRGRFFAKNLSIKVKALLPLTCIVQFMNDVICFSFSMCTY